MVKWRVWLAASARKATARERELGLLTYAVTSKCRFY